MRSNDELKVVVSLASLPKRLPGIKPVFESLKQQTLQPDRIHLWMCPFYDRLNQTFSLDQLPDWLADYDIETALVQDKGPVTKLYPAIDRYVDTNTVVVIMDDDSIAPPNFLKTLVESALELKAVCGSLGRVLARPDCTYKGGSSYGHGHWCVPWPEGRLPVRVDILLGNGGIAFPPGTLSRDFLSFLSGYSVQYDVLQRMCDDMWISGFLAMRDIERFAVYIPGEFVRTDNYNTDDLWSTNKHYDFNRQSVALFRYAW
jgi:hypothetical protein